jgi:hypothetical protein
LSTSFSSSALAGMCFSTVVICLFLVPTCIFFPLVFFHGPNWFSDYQFPRYPSIVERLLRARLVYQRPQMDRAVSFEYMNRQLVWHEFSVSQFIFWMVCHFISGHFIWFDLVWATIWPNLKFLVFQQFELSLTVVEVGDGFQSSKKVTLDIVSLACKLWERDTLIVSLVFQYALLNHCQVYWILAS